MALYDNFSSSDLENKDTPMRIAQNTWQIIHKLVFFFLIRYGKQK